MNTEGENCRLKRKLVLHRIKRARKMKVFDLDELVNASLSGGPWDPKINSVDAAESILADTPRYCMNDEFKAKPVSNMNDLSTIECFLERHEVTKLYLMLATLHGIFNKSICRLFHHINNQFKRHLMKTHSHLYNSVLLSIPNFNP
jgi:hypothetical protein